MQRERKGQAYRLRETKRHNNAERHWDRQINRGAKTYR